MGIWSRYTLDHLACGDDRKLEEATRIGVEPTDQGTTRYASRRNTYPSSLLIEQLLDCSARSQHGWSRTQVELATGG